MEELEKLADEATERGTSVEEFTGKAVDFSAMQDSTFQQIFSLAKAGESDRAAELEQALDRSYC